jgi:hypothetical protein
MKIEKKWREKLQLVTAFLFGTIFNLNMQNSLAQREFKMKKKNNNRTPLFADKRRINVIREAYHKIFGSSSQFFGIQFLMP